MGDSSTAQAASATGFTVWFTGLPSSGKSTLAQLVLQRLSALGLPVEVLDGDEVRKRLTKGLGFSRADRDANIDRITFVAAAITRSGGVAVTCAISPYQAARDAARREIDRFVEVYVECPVEECARRDVKGLYQKAMAGEISNFTGVNDPYEPPPNPEVVVHTAKETPEESLERIMAALVNLGYVSRETNSLVTVSLPRPLVEKVRSEAGVGWTDVSTAVAGFVTKALAAPPSEADMPPDKREQARQKLRSLGYLSEEGGK